MVLFRTRSSGAPHSRRSTAEVPASPQTPECSEVQEAICSSPSSMAIDVELAKTLARLEDFNIDTCGYRRRKGSPRVSSPSSHSKGSGFFSRRSGRKVIDTSKANALPKIANMKIEPAKTDAMLKEAMTVVRARPRAVLRSSKTTPPKSPRQQKLHCAVSSDIQFNPNSAVMKTPTQTKKIRNVLELSTVSTSVQLDGTPVARSRRRTVNMVQSPRCRSPIGSTSGKRVSPVPSSVASMMQALKNQMPQSSDDDDDDKSDSSTMHLLKIDENHHDVICQSNSEQRSEDKLLPPTLTITTSRMTTTSILGASDSSLLFENDGMGDDDDFIPSPILRETISRSSVHTLEWKSYNKYYESPRSPTQLREGSSWGSEPSKIRAAVHTKLPTTPLGRNKNMFLAPPLETQPSIGVSSCGGHASNESGTPAAAAGRGGGSQRETNNNNSPAATTTTSIEVAPGHSVSIRGADETLLYVAADAASTPRNQRTGGLIMTNKCLTCTSTVHCVWDAEFMLCPVCLTVQPAGNKGGSGCWGIGLGFLPDDWKAWKASLAATQQIAS